MAKTLLQNTSIVILGAWNVGILNTQWFKIHFPEFLTEPETPVEVALGPKYEIRFTLSHILIHVSSDRIMLFPKQENDQCYENITKLSTGIFNKLPHTPISNIGHNIAYQLVDNESFKLFKVDQLRTYKEFYNENLESEYFSSQQIKHIITFEDHILNLTYDMDQERNILSFNFHYDVKNTSKIKKFLSDFRKNLLESKEIFNKLVE